MSDIHKMSLSSLLCQIDSIKDNSASFLPGEGKQDPDKKIWQDDVDACNAATEIIKKLCEENCFSVDEAISYIAQSKKLLQDWGNLHAKYEVPSQPVKKDGVWHCPDCNHRVNPQFESRNAPIQFDLHNCKDGSYGMADFQGMKKVGDSDG